MRRLLTCLSFAVMTAGGACSEDPPAAGDIAVPSGQAVQFVDVITNVAGSEGATARFRFLAPGISGNAIDGETVAADMQALCDGYALPRTDGMVPAPQQIIISLSDRPVEFGAASPDATQYFEAYSIGNGACIWEVF